VRIFLDANILFSAAKSAGAVRELLARASAAGHTLCTDAYVEAEARRNLTVKAPAGLPALDALLVRVELSGYSGGELSSEIATLLPEEDQPVLAAAIRLRCDALVTGDRTHFGAIYGKKAKGVMIHSPISMAEALGLSRKP
jgi:predicted nucleic acid-binding protein